MPNHPKDNPQGLKTKIQNLQSEWLETLEELRTGEEEMKNNDLFRAIAYLSICDRFLINIDEFLKEIEILQRDSTPKDLLGDIQELKRSIEKKRQNIEEEYPILAENTLRRAEDLISKFAESMAAKGDRSNLKTEISQNLDKELFLQELKDSLETYRATREDFVSTLTVNPFRKSLETSIPEDLGEEMPEIDSILSQLDTVITACDTALLIKEINE